MKKLRDILGASRLFQFILKCALEELELSALSEWGPSRRPVLPFGDPGLRQAFLPAKLSEILLQGHHCRVLAPKSGFPTFES